MACRTYRLLVWDSFSTRLYAKRVGQASYPAGGDSSNRAATLFLSTVSQSIFESIAKTAFVNW